eukprot:CAMPEP_0183712128 /NCGR_PEP_ID=MMETSP0737-20130205/7360_1 /TAXON_ID=385413 /ORGANISM="Thalassiosira miniscula, Strain CCMP1093" /LENGTH=493 /DNA_ID=CAMNT_0025940707 /DNA_START=288 /DNA_END=1769 /DNA_ORIENTATION=-
MATKSVTGGAGAGATATSSGAAGGALGTPPSTAAPSTISSRQVSREPSASVNNNPYEGGTTRGGRTNSIAEPPASAAARRGIGGGATHGAMADGAVENNAAPGPGTSSMAPGGNAGASSSSQNNNNSSASASSANNNNGGNSAAETISYSAERIIGNGSFGVVFQASVVETGEIVAIKKVLQDKRFKNRELQIMRQLVKDGHSNIVGLKHCFYSQGEKQDELYLNLVLEYVPETVYSISRHHQKSKMALPLLYVKLYLYQLSRALSHIHALGICHRDIKPQNLLVNPENQQLKLCDFGSAKALVRGEPNVSYICSRYYRAPELIFGSTDYSTAIDVWSQGCVGAELLLGQPLFPGDSGVDQLVEIIKVLGTPTREEISSMNSNYTEFKFPQIKACQWRKVFRSKTPEEAMDFIGSTLAYDPERRIRPLEGCGHAFFDELRDERTRLPNGNPLPPLFDFTHHELGSSPQLLAKLVPPHINIEDINKGDSKPHAR